MRIIRIGVGALFFCCFLKAIVPSSGLAMGFKPHPPSSWIRVAVMQKAKDLTVRVKGPYRIVTSETSEVLAEGRSLRSTIVKPAQSGVLFGSDEYKIFGIRIETERSKAIQVNDRKYRGLLEIFREKDLTLTVVNRVGIEEYIYGVLRHEIAPWWPREAMKAQAVAIRTYAAYQRSQNIDKDYDVTGDVLSQVYGGAKGETRKIRKTARETWGEMLTWKGEIFPAYYSSTCGGHTESAAEVWGEALAPLAGGSCTFCTTSKHYLWEKDIALGLVQKKLRWNKYDAGPIAQIRAVDRTPSGRVKTLEIQHAKGTLQLTGHQFRMHIGPNLIRSALFTPERHGDKLRLEGRGWGHGVGLCQWGMYTQAQRGRKYEDILSFYYPGARIVAMDPEYPNGAQGVSKKIAKRLARETNPKP